MKTFYRIFILSFFFSYLFYLTVLVSFAKTSEEESISKETEQKKYIKKGTAPPNSSTVEKLTNKLNFLNTKQKTPQNQKKKAMSHRKYKKTIDRLESLENNSSSSLLILAQAYENTEDYKNQIRVLKQLVKKNKKNGAYLLELAKGLRKFYFKTGLLKYREESITIINKIFELDRKHHEKAHLEMLKLLKYNEDSKETNYAILKLLQKLIREFGMKRAYVKDICKYFYINKFYSQSLAGCKKAMQYDPKEPSNYVYYALSMKEPEDMEKHLKRAGKQFSKSLFTHIKIGQFFIQQKDYKSALPHFKSALKINRNSAEGQLGLAQSLFHNKKEKESFKHFLQACMLDKPKMLWAFKQAKSILNQKSKFKLASSFQSGITKCFLKAPKVKK